MTVKAIETQYNGYRFRSRLEARWAVFFDTLSVKYLYEPEGFDLDGLWYLPDFWLPDWSVYVEIKPEKLENIEADKAMRLATSSHRVIALIGEPWPEGHSALVFDQTDYANSDSGAWVMEHAFFADCRRCAGVNLDGDGGCIMLGPHQCGDRWKESMTRDLSVRTQGAYTAARQARFEHGENGVRR